MDAWTRVGERKLVENQRRRPRPPSVLHFQAAGTGEPPPADAAPPDQVHLETTRTTGEVVPWLDDLFWIELIRRWQDRPLALHVMPTPFSLLHPVVLHNMEMLRRVTPRWRRVGHAYLDDVLTDEEIARLAGAPYDEVRIIDEPRPGIAKPAAELRGVTFQALVGRVLRLQAAARSTRPVLVRVPPQTVSSAILQPLIVSEAIHTST